MRVLRAMSIWASFLSSSAHVLADDSPTQKVQASKVADSGEQSSAPVAAAPANSDADQLATIAYQKARASYARGDVRGALDSMRESYRLSKRAELLYNLAELENELKACPDALADYRHYLELVPDGRHRDSATQKSRQLEKQCGPPPAPAPSTPEPVADHQRAPDRAVEPPPTSYWTPARIAGWSTISAGVIAGASAVYFQLEAVQARNDFQQSVDEANAGGPAVDMGLQARQHRYNNVAIGLGIASGALIASGVVIILLNPGAPESRSQSASFYALPGLLGARYVQHF